jgi:exosome complex RNA-binding protein Csl4
MLNRSGVALALLLLIALSATAQDGGIGIAPMPMPTPAAGVTGFVTTVSGNLITILNGAVTVDATGAVFYNRKGNATIADVKPGLQIVATIKNLNAAPGTMLQASHITILDSPAGSLNGPVQSVDVAGSALTIFGARVLVTADTRIFSFRRDGATKLADIKPGDTVAVQVNISGSALIAEMIQLLAPIPNVSLDGTVKSIGATAWVITTRNGDVTVTVDAQTKIDPTVKAGDLVHVSGIADAAGNITALFIYSAKPVPPPPAPAVEGTVKSIGATSWVITTRDGSDVTVAVSSNTKIDPTIKVGDHVVVLGTADAAGNITAIAIYANNPRPVTPPDASQLEGTVKSIGTTTWIITTRDGKDVTVIVNANTKIDPTLKAGDAVIVIGTRDASGNLVAAAIVKANTKQHATRR